MLALGTSRFSLSDLYLSTNSAHRNFTIFTSVNFIFISIIATLLSTKILLKQKNYFSLFFLIFVILSIIFGFFYKINPQNWKMPPPYQLEFAFQYFLIFSLYKIIKISKKDIFLKICLCLLILLSIYRSYFFIKKFYEIENQNDIYEKILIENKNPTTNLWLKDNFIFKKDELIEKKVFIYISSFDSEFFGSLKVKDSKNMYELYMKSLTFNSKFNGSLQDFSWWKNNIITSFGYSHILDINSTLANYFNPSVIEFYDEVKKKNIKIKLTDNRFYSYQTIPQFNYNNSLLNFYKFDYILSDKLLTNNSNVNYKIHKIYKFNGFNFYLYKIFNIKKKLQIKKINIVRNIENYQKDLNKFKDELFIYDYDLEKVSKLKNFCDVESFYKNNNIIFSAKKINQDPCIAIFPIPYSYNNNFTKINQNDSVKINCASIRVQYYFHGCIINENSKYLLKKNNTFLYSIGSFKDYLYYKKNK
jgi:hypothetical protein